MTLDLDSECVRACVNYIQVQLEVGNLGDQVPGVLGDSTTSQRRVELTAVMHVAGFRHSRYLLQGGRNFLYCFLSFLLKAIQLTHTGLDFGSLESFGSCGDFGSWKCLKILDSFDSLGSLNNLDSLELGELGAWITRILDSSQLGQLGAWIARSSELGQLGVWIARSLDSQELGQLRARGAWSLDSQELGQL